LANPKSAILALPLCIKILSDLISLCSTALPGLASLTSINAEAIYLVTLNASLSDNVLFLIFELRVP